MNNPCLKPRELQPRGRSTGSLIVIIIILISFIYLQAVLSFAICPLIESVCIELISRLKSCINKMISQHDENFLFLLFHLLPLDSLLIGKLFCCVYHLYSSKFGLISPAFGSVGSLIITRGLETIVLACQINRCQFSKTLKQINHYSKILSFFTIVFIISSLTECLLASQEGLLVWIRGTDSCVGRAGKQKQKCCYGVGLESTLYVSRYQTCVGKVCAVVIHPTSKLKSHFSMQQLISSIMSQEKSEQCSQ